MKNIVIKVGTLFTDFNSICTKIILDQSAKVLIIIMIEETTTIQVPPNRSLFKRGSFYDCFYQLVSGSLLVSISHTTIEITTPIIIGDYQIIENIDYRVSNIKAINRCTLKAIPVSQYSKYSTYNNEIEKAFGKFQFKSRALHYWLKKTFQIHVVKRCQQTNTEQSIGIILQGVFKIDRNIPIVKMKHKQFQLLRKFQICQLGYGQIFEDTMVCQSTQGTVALCQHVYVKQLSKHFDQFEKVIKLTTLKDEVHCNMERQIYKNCRKKAKLYQNMVPLPLKSQIKIEESQNETTDKKTGQKLTSVSTDIFRLTNNISQFLHLQWKKGLSLQVKRKDPSPTLSPKKNYSKLKKAPCQFQLLKMIDQSPKRSLENEQIRVNLWEKAHKNLPIIKSLRIKTEGDEKSFFKFPAKIK